MNTLALIPAKARSTGIPGKNTRYFAGKPLFAWAVEVGLATCTKTYVTSDDPNIGIMAAQWGAGVIVRPKSLATDDAPMILVVKHALSSLSPGFGPDVVVLLQPTQPFRRAKHVKLALEMLTEDWDSVVSVVEIPAHFSPDYAMKISDGRLLAFNDHDPARRQDARPAYSRDGTVYATRAKVVKAGSLYGGDCRPLIIPAGESCNLDTEDDWSRAERMVETYAESL